MRKGCCCPPRLHLRKVPGLFNSPYAARTWIRPSCPPNKQPIHYDVLAASWGRSDKNILPINTTYDAAITTERTTIVSREESGEMNALAARSTTKTARLIIPHLSYHPRLCVKIATKVSGWKARPSQDGSTKYRPTLPLARQ